MAHSVDWTGAYEGQPDGATVDADTIDTLLQQLKVAIRERGNDFVVDWNADPVVLKPSSNLKLAQIMTIGPQGMGSRQDQDDCFITNAYFQSDDSGDNSNYLAFHFLKNWKITKIEAVIDRSTETSVALKIHKTSLIAVPVTSQVGSTVTKVTAGISVETLFSGTEITDGGSSYVMTVSGTGVGRWRFYGAKVTYDEV